ncbi:hypothetical protein GCM10011505_03580 [Tistrella bauzanensis]|uniref:Uncharacterized protein n=1 Tax=Tistrella bauzanensis TaxID=657419 RepID=A0ABQ1IA96_9PROT|nr:hypothetical protein [Tistrella bauzanensis]GGB25660.1 hypothetical protein GCM10011505_03580 [Tistrella bauzanensis]
MTDSSAKRMDSLLAMALAIACAGAVATITPALAEDPMERPGPVDAQTLEAAPETDPGTNQPVPLRNSLPGTAEERVRFEQAAGSEIQRWDAEVSLRVRELQLADDYGSNRARTELTKSWEDVTQRYQELQAAPDRRFDEKKEAFLTAWSNFEETWRRTRAT